MERLLDPAQPGAHILNDTQEDEHIPEIKRMHWPGIIRRGLPLAVKLLPPTVEWVLRGRSLASPKMMDLGMPVSLRGLVILGLWSDYTGVSFGEFKAAGTYELAHFFKEYIHLVDDQIDGGLAGGAKLAASEIKRDDLNRVSVSHIVSAVINHVPDRDKRRAIISEIQQCRRRAIKAIEREQELGPFAKSEDVIRMREDTTANTMSTLISVLNVAHEVPPERGKNFENAFVNMCMALQVKDDIVDLAQDWGQNQNIFAGYVVEQPDEEAMLKKRLLERKPVGMKWLRENTPKTLARTYSLYRRYQQGINPYRDPKLAVMEEMGEFVFHELENIFDVERIGIWERVKAKSARQSVK